MDQENVGNTVKGSLVDETRDDGEEFVTEGTRVGASSVPGIGQIFLDSGLRVKVQPNVHRWTPSFPKNLFDFTFHESTLKKLTLYWSSPSDNWTNRFSPRQSYEFLRSLSSSKKRGTGWEERKERRGKRGEFSCDTREKRNTRTRANTARVLFARVTSSYVSATKNNGRRWGTKGTFRKHSRNNRVNADRSYASLATPFIHRLSCLSPFATHGFEREKGRNSWVENSWCWNTGSWILSKSISLRKYFVGSWFFPFSRFSLYFILFFLFLFSRFGERGQWKWVSLVEHKFWWFFTIERGGVFW